MWYKFATKVEQGKDKFIQTRNSGTRDGFPWINQEIHHLMRKRDKLYKSWPRSGRPHDQSKFLDYKHLGNILGINIEIPDKNVREQLRPICLTLLKHSKQDSNVIAPLKENGQTLLPKVGKANALNDQF